MVGYDSQADALTLGDDDELKVGDYEISYNSSNDQWQAEYTPTSDVSHVPKNQSGSLFPTDFADALDGKALADDGNLYDSVQTAENNATGFVFIGPGTFNESVNISTTGLTLQGSGYDTHVDASGGDDAFLLNAPNVSVQNLSVTGGASNTGFRLSDSNLRVTGCIVRDSGGDAFYHNGGTDHIISACRVLSSGGSGFNIRVDRVIVRGCYVESGVSSFGIYVTDYDDCIIANNVIVGVGGRGIFFNNPSSDDNIAIGNRIHNCGSDGMKVQGTDCILANNRVSDSGGADIDNVGGATLDDNLTGPSN